MNTSISFISVDSIVNHVNNPRKMLGDLTELRDSIQKNGILQPLTVVPFEGGYKVVIGHRRLEAAKQAGLEEVPCEVRDLSDEEQLNIMMMENMLRENLTTYEEAKGFQMMLDLGKSVETIAEETGFSQSTIRSRTKLLGFDEKKFKESVERGATLHDLTKLYEIDDEHTRNAMLKYAGTNDFNAKVNRAIQNQELDRKYQEALNSISAWATKIDTVGLVNGEHVAMRFFAGWNVWSTGNVPSKPEGEETYYYTADVHRISVYVAGEDTAEAERKARWEREKMVGAQLESVKRACFNLRLEFVKNFGNFRKHGKTIYDAFVKAAVEDMTRTSYRVHDHGILLEVLGIGDLNQISEQNPDRVSLAMLMVYHDSSDACCWRQRWTGSEYVYVYEPNEKLLNWYAFLTSIGYQISSDEQAMLNGEVEYVQREEVA